MRAPFLVSCLIATHEGSDEPQQSHKVSVSLCIVSALALGWTPAVPSSSPSLRREGLSLFRHTYKPSSVIPLIGVLHAKSPASGLKWGLLAEVASFLHYPAMASTSRLAYLLKVIEAALRP